MPLGESGNFDALRSARPQLHVYGAVPSGMAGWAERRGLELHTFPYTAAAREAGLLEHAVYLVQPDGYVSAAQPTFESAVLDAVLSEGWGRR